MTDLCQCPRCGRAHLRLGNPPDSIRYADINAALLIALETLIDAASRKDSEKYIGRALFEARETAAKARTP